MTDYFERALRSGAEPQNEAASSDASEDYFARALKRASSQSTTLQKKAPPFPGYKDPKEEGWAESIGRTITGRQDPRFKGLPSLEEAMLAEGSENALMPMRRAVPFTHSDQGLGNVAVKGLGDRFVRQEQDAYGYPVVTYRGKDGQEKQAYINKPGLDREDVGRGIAQAVPYVMTGGVAGAVTKGAKWVYNAAAQAAAAGGTSILTDTAGGLLGSDEGTDLSKAAITGGIAGAVPVAGAALAPLVRRFWTVPGLYDKTAGALTPKGEAAARASGIDPAMLTSEIAKEFAEEYAKTGSARIGSSVAGREFGIQQSRGQMTKDPGQLLTEKAMRTGGYGDSAKGMMDTFDRTQAMQIEAAARGGSDAKRSIAHTLNPGIPARGSTPRTMGDNIRGSVGEAEQAATADASASWSQVGKITPTPQAMQELPTFIGPKLGELPIDKTLTKASAGMLDDVRAFMKGELPSEYADVIGRQAIPDVVQMRRRLFATMRTAENQTDKAAARAIYEGFGDWIEQSAASAANSGNPVQAAALRVATDKTRELKAIFGESGSNGSTPGRKIMQDIISNPDVERTPERIISRLFTVDTGATPKAGSVEALRLMKQGFQKYMPPDRAEAAMADLKLAWWKRTIETPAGELHTPAMMSKRIDQAFNSQGSMVNELLSREEKNLIRRFGAAMKDIAWKDPNPSGTGTANQFYVGQFGQTVFRMIGASKGPIAGIFSMLLRSTPAVNGFGSTMAQRAINPVVRPYSSSVPASTVGAATRSYQELETASERLSSLGELPASQAGPPRSSVNRLVPFSPNR